jgi:DNA-binding PucR family transcriptional regulator
VSPDLQVLVDQLAQTLKRPAMVDDVRWRAVAYSPVDSRVDEVRLRSILQRQAPQEAVAWACGLGVDEATTPFRMPANRAVGADPRLLINLRHDHLFLGRLVMVDHDADITDGEVREAERSADEIAHALHHQRLIEGGVRERERTLLRDLLGEYPDPRLRAAHTIRDEALLSSHPLTALLVIRVQDQDPAHATGEWSVLEQIVESLRRSIGPDRSLSLVRPGHAIVLVGARSQDELRELAREARDRATTAVGASATVGICPLAEALDDGETGVRRATAAARIAARIPRFERVASWHELSGYGALITLVDAEPLDHGLLDPAVSRLVEADRHGALLHTLESYLDHGGDVQRTAQHVSLQRAGLYYRLRRIQEVTGVDLKDGEARLGLHMSIKLLRLAGGSQFAETAADRH